MDLLTRIEASLEFMNDGGPIGDRVDFVNLREFLEGSREALLVMQQIEEALRHGFSVEPGSFLHDEVTRLCSGGPRLRLPRDLLDRLEQQLETRETELAPVSRQNDVLGRCKGCGAPPEEACVCGAAVRASTAPDVRRALARCALALSREADTIRELAPTIDGKCYLDHIVDDACEALGCTAGELAKISESRPEIVRKFYIHDTTRGCVGNSMVWWKRGHHGYTCDIREAHVFVESELPQYLRHATDLVAYPVEHVRATVAHHIDAQRIDRSLGVKREDLA